MKNREHNPNLSHSVRCTLVHCLHAFNYIHYLCTVWKKTDFFYFFSKVSLVCIAWLCFSAAFSVFGPKIPKKGVIVKSYLGDSGAAVRCIMFLQCFIFHLHILFLFDRGRISAGMSSHCLILFFFLICAARKMFPKRKLNESSSESQKDEAEEKEASGHRNKRPRVESSGSAAGNASPRL